MAAPDPQFPERTNADATGSPEPVGEVDPRFSQPGAGPARWDEVVEALRAAQVHWVTTVRADGRPHVTPLLTVWHDGALHFCTGPGEQKARNLAHEPRCALTTGSDRLDTGLDVVVEGVARAVGDEPTLVLLADAWVAKYGEDWRFEVHDGAFRGEGGRAEVVRVDATKVLAFTKGQYAQTRFSI